MKQNEYRITALPVLSGASEESPLRINKAGAIAGYSLIGGHFVATLWSSGEKPVQLSVSGKHATAIDINDRGDIVGNVFTGRQGETRAVLWIRGKKLVDLGTLGGSYSYAHAISSEGHVVGEAQLADQRMHAFLYRDGKMLDLATEGGECSYARAITDSNLIAGMFRAKKGEDLVPVRFTPQGMVRLPVPKGMNATLDGMIYDAAGKDLIIGRSLAWRGDRVAETLDRDMEPLGVNRNGVVVGAKYMGVGTFDAVRWKNKRLETLERLIPPEPRWMLEAAHDINDAGQIVGVGWLDRKRKAYRLDPVR